MKKTTEKPAKKAAPTVEKKAAVKPAPKAAAPTPPAQVIVEEVKLAPALPQPDPATGPNAKFPYAILVTDKGKVYFDRFKTAKERDRRRGALEKRVTAIENVEYEPELGNPQGITLTGGQKVEAPKSTAADPKGPRLVKGAASDPSVSKRVTPGARIDTWRIARSVRVGKPGFFLQGGHEEKAGGRVRFIVGEEEHFTSLHKAKEAQVAKLPPSDDPEEVPTHSSKVK